jgi:glycosidase
MKPIIYQVLLRLAGNRKNTGKIYGTIKENGCGKFNDLNGHFLNEIKAFGATHIWLTGAIEHATCTNYSKYGIKPDNKLVVKGMAGSPYAIKDYYDVSPDLAVDVENRMLEFEALIKRCNAIDLKPIIDFVPNHLAREYQSDARPPGIIDFGQNDNKEKAFDLANNFYYLTEEALVLPKEVYELPYLKDVHESFLEFPAKATGNDQFSPRPSFTDWYETIKLNYGVDYLKGQKKLFNPRPDTWEKMIEVLLFWAEKGIMGFRCDMAEMVPVEFWTWAIKKIKEKYPDLVFIAEIYNPDAYHAFVKTAGFDFLYDKVGLYDCLRDVLEGKMTASCIESVWKNLNGLDSKMLRFMENHDEQRVASKHFAHKPERAIPAMVVSALLHQGPLMIYFGQELGEAAEGASGFSGDDGRTSIFDYFHVPAFQQWFNNGKCTEDLLSESAKAIRGFYKDLNQICQEPVITKGDFYDLSWANASKELYQKDQIYSFIRHDKKTAWLIATNFNAEENLETEIIIPGHFFEHTGLNKKFSLGNIRYKGKTPKILFLDNGDAVIHFIIQANGFAIFLISP